MSFKKNTLLLPLLLQQTLAQVSLYQPCPILGPWVPSPIIDTSTSTIKSKFDLFTKFIDNYVAEANGTFGPISPNTTSFSIGLFAGANSVNRNDTPSFYEYHHGAGKTQPDADAVYAAGDLTQLFTVFTLLAELGDSAWSKSIVQYLPELASPSRNASNGSTIRTVKWEDVTLGDLSGHMAGIARDSNACRIDKPCDEHRFLATLAAKPTVYLPDTTPIFSRAAFQLLASAIERECKQPFAQVLSARILNKLAMKNTSFLSPNTTVFGNGITNASLLGEPAAVSLTTTINDLSLFGRSILTSSILSPAMTRRWLKPYTSTSNIRNAVGRPWEIYHFSDESTDPIIDIYTYEGSLGRYSSYFGITPDYDVGFAILAVNGEGNAPDLNAYADMVLFALTQIDALGKAEAKANLAGMYGSGNSSLVLNLTDSDPGLAVSSLKVNGSDWLANIAEQSGIEPKYVDFRLNPTNLVDDTALGKKQAFRGVIQDKSALADAGTVTCVSWQTVGELERGNWALDEFIFELGSGGKAISVSSPALGVRFERKK